VVALLVGFGMSAVGQGHAQSPARLAAQGSTITQSFTFTGPEVAVSMTGQASFIGTSQGQLADGAKFTESYAGVAYPAAANGCEAYTFYDTRTFATPGDAYDYVGTGVGCPVLGHAGETKSTSTIVITGGTGRYKGAIGTGDAAITSISLPAKVAGQYPFNLSGSGNFTITLASQ
jgi:hypothetical protein